MCAAMLTALLLVPQPEAANAQPGRPMPRVGVLSPFIGSDNAFFDTFRNRMQQLGYVEGRSVAYVK